MPVTNHAVRNPILEAISVYNREPCARTWEEDLDLHLIGGHVHCTPDYFIMGRPVCKDASQAEIVDPSIRFKAPDCWHIYLAAGNISLFWQHETIKLAWVSWERNNQLRIYPMERVKRYFL